MENQNTKLIEGLRQAAGFLEAHPDIPALYGTIYEYVCSKEHLLTFAQTLGTFQKEMDDTYVTLMKVFGVVTLSVRIPRDRICKKVVKWECPEEGLLEMASELEGEG